MPDITIEARVGIQAPAEAIWAVLKDIEAWPSWNPIYTAAKGTLGYGKPLVFTLALPDTAPREMIATVTEWIPEQTLRWTTTMMGGWVKTARYIDIEKVIDGACIVGNGESMTGFLADRAARKVGRQMFNGFEAMGLALKDRAEALWRSGELGST